MFADGDRPFSACGPQGPRPEYPEHTATVPEQAAYKPAAKSELAACKQPSISGHTACRQNNPEYTACMASSPEHAICEPTHPELAVRMSTNSKHAASTKRKPATGVEQGAEAAE